MADEIGAAFGVYPSSGRRPERLNVSRGVNAPLQLARGWTAGLLGLPGDIEGLGRLLRNIGPEGLSHMRNVGQTSSLPTSDFYREYLPGYDPAPAARAFSGLGALTGGLGATKVAGAAVKGAKATGEALGPKAAEMAESYLQRSGLAPTVVKPKGGNWLSGSVEKATEPLVPKPGARGRPASETMREMEATYPPDVLQSMSPETSETVNRSFAALKPDVAVEDWINTKLNKYIRNEMGTPEDPVRKLAERDVLHVDPEQVGVNRWKAPDVREKQGYPREGMGQSEAAKAWEAASDVSIFTDRAGDINTGFPLEIVRENPWLSKLDPSAKVHELDAPTARGLGFDHLIDELRNATRADSDLPANLKWKPEDLKKVTMEQAVERVAKINEYRAAKKAEANEVLARNPATAPYKDYETVPGTQEPNQKGLAWKQIRVPNNETMSLEERKELIAKLREQGENPETWPQKQLQAALKYEGEVMGHCVGGYCDDVLTGKSQIYSLRDKKGEPHVTIEVAPLDVEQGISSMPPEQRQAFLKEVKDRYFGGRTPNMGEQDKYFQLQEQEYLRKYGAPPPDIVQIKGKGNKAPKDEYLPFVQDFVRSGEWSKVGDLKNTGLIEVGENSAVGQMLKQAGETNIPPYVTRQEYDQIIERFNLRPGFGLPQGFAEGGFVQNTEAQPPMLDEMRLEMMDRGYAGGGLIKALKAATKSHPTVFPPVAPLTQAEMRPMAQRIAEQMTGEFVRPNPQMSKNPAGKSRKVFEREKTLPVEVKEKTAPRDVPVLDYESMKDAYVVGVPGDPSLGSVIKPGTLSSIHEGGVELRRLGDVEFGVDNPTGAVQLFGGPRYADESFWASNLGPARAIQNTVNELGELGPVYGQYIKMAPASTNFALHNLDALLAYQQPEKLSKSKIRQLNREIRRGSPKYGDFPGFQGFEDPIDVLLQAQMNSDLRKHIAETLMKPDITNALGLRPGSDVLFGITTPSLRNLETGVSGYSVGRMMPGGELTPSLHPTYDFDIPGTLIGQTKYPVPYEIAFPQSTAYTRANLKPGAQEFNTLKMIGAREKIDPQYIDQIKMYEELMKEYTGKKEGGLVKPEGADDFAKQIMAKITNNRVSTEDGNRISH